MGDVLAGSANDVYMNVWANWWTGKALSEGLEFYQTDFLFYPRGVSLVFHSFSHTNTAISLLLTPMVGRFAAYNVTILLAYVVSGFGMYLLVSYLTDCPPAAFIAGLVFAFHPYHVFESAHPVTVTTQWIPLFVLALIRLLRETGASRVKQTFLAVLWFLLTALSSWHLMTMLLGWTALFLAYGLFRARQAASPESTATPETASVLANRTGWAPGAIRTLLLFFVVAGLLVAPFILPIIRELLTEGTADMDVETADGLGNDLLSFLVPNQRHPLFGSIFANVYDQIGLTSRRPAYLGYIPMFLAIAGTVAFRRRTRFWVLALSVFFVLSLGSQVKFVGTALHAFQLPWAAPIINLLRNPFRLNVMLFFCFAVLVGFGTCWVYGRIAERTKLLAYSLLLLVAGLVLFEYLVYPFPTTKPLHSPFYAQLAQEEGEFAVIDLPMGRRPARFGMFFQTIHGKKLVDGHVSRTPQDAYDFVDANQLLGALRAGSAPDPGLDIDQELASLADRDIRYIILHKHLLYPRALRDWQRWLVGFPTPYYEDDMLIVYRTASVSKVH